MSANDPKKWGAEDVERELRAICQASPGRVNPLVNGQCVYRSVVDGSRCLIGELLVSHGWPYDPGWDGRDDEPDGDGNYPVRAAYSLMSDLGYSDAAANEAAAWQRVADQTLVPWGELPATRATFDADA